MSINCTSTDCGKCGWKGKDHHELREQKSTHVNIQNKRFKNPKGDASPESANGVPTKQQYRHGAVQQQTTANITTTTTTATVISGTCET